MKSASLTHLARSRSQSAAHAIWSAVPGNREHPLIQLNQSLKQLAMSNLLHPYNRTRRHTLFFPACKDAGRRGAQVSMRFCQEFSGLVKLCLPLIRPGVKPFNLDDIGAPLFWRDFRRNNEAPCIVEIGLHVNLSISSNHSGRSSSTEKGPLRAPMLPVAVQSQMTAMVR